MSLYPGRSEAPDELDRLMAAALHAAVRDARPPACLRAAVRAAAAPAPAAPPQRSALRSLLDGLLACLEPGEERWAVPVIVYKVSFADLGSLSPGLALPWDVYRGGRCEPGGRGFGPRTLARACR